MPTKHVPVLLNESIEALDLSPGEIFLDGTLGGGGHSREVLRRFPKVDIIALDCDPLRVERIATALKITARVENISNLDKILKELKIEKVDAILFDLGLSTDQLEPGEKSRGFSFLRNEPLDMRLSSKGLKAKDLLNSWDEHAIELVLKGFGEERYSKKIAREIVRRRGIKPFETTFDLVEAILEVKPKNWREKIHPATKTFQALRIATNDELTHLELGLEKGFRVLKSGGRMVVISFHSLEDRIVKKFIKERLKEGTGRLVELSPAIKAGKPITPSHEEVVANPRSRSAKLRVIEKI